MGISIDGLISGLDTASIITSLLELQRRPVELLESKQEVIDEQLSAWQGINTSLLAMETAAQSMNSASEFKAVGGVFANNNTLQGSVVDFTVNSNATAGNYNLTVSQLATQQKMISNQGFGSISQNIGNYSVTLTTSSGSQTFYNSTLDEIRTSINSSDLGVTASIINTSSSSTPYYRLQLTSSEPGTANTFTVEVDQGVGGPGANPELLTFGDMQVAQDAIVQLDGITITRSTNTFSDIIEGVELNLISAGSGTITFSTDTDQIVGNIEEFVNAYNGVMDSIREQFVYDQSANDAAALFGNSTLLNIQMTLSNIMSGIVSGLSISSDPYATLSQIGVRTDSTGQVTIDENELTQALNGNFDGVRDLFVSSGSGAYTFVTAGGGTAAGIYDTRVVDDSDGNPAIQMRIQGSTGEWITLVSDGSYWNAPNGSTLEGLVIQGVNIATGQTGTMSVSVGIAEQFAYQTGFITEFSTEGAIFNERRHLEKSKDDYQDQIDALNLRIDKMQESLTRKYAMLEVTLGQLKGQSDYLTEQLSRLSGSSS